MPPSTKKSKKIGVENHAMVLRKHRQSSFLPPTSQRKAFNEIGNVVQRFDARASISLDFLKEDGKPNQTTRKSVVSTDRLKMFSKSPSVDGNPRRKSTKLQSAATNQSNQTSVDALMKKPPPVLANILPPPPWQMKTRSSVGLSVKRAPRLTMKPPDSPSDVAVGDRKTRSSLSRHRQLILPPPPPMQPVIHTEVAEVKVKCKLSHKKNKTILNISGKDDIDLLHRGCPWMVSPYAKHIYSYLQKLESKIPITKWIASESTVADKTRANIVDWLACSYHELRLLQETYLLSVSLLDRYLMGAHKIESDKLQLVALVCLSLAVKFEEAIPGSIKEMLKLTKETYTKAEFVKMEADVIQILDFRICRPVSISFLRRYNLAARCDRVQHTYGKYLIDLAQLDKSLASERPSRLAAAAVYVGLCITKSEVSSHLWSPLLLHYTSYSFQDIQPVVSRIASIAMTGGGPQDSIWRKYSSETNYRVATEIKLQLPLLQKLK